MHQSVMIRRCIGIPLFAVIVALLMIGLLLGQTKGRGEQKFKLDPFDLLLEAEQPNGLRGVYVVHWLEDRNDRDDYIPAKVKLVIPHGSRPRWSPQRNYILYEQHDWIVVMDRRTGKTVKGWMGGLPVYGWGPDDNTILIGAYRTPQTEFALEGLGFKTLWKDPWDTWEEWEDMFQFPTIGIPAQYGITFPHPKLEDDLWLGAPTMSPDWSMHAFEGYRVISNYGRNYSKIYVVKWIKPPLHSKGHDYLPVWRLTALPPDLLEVNPKFSPDGKWIAFEVIDPKASTHRVYLATPDGRVIRPIPLTFYEKGKLNLFELRRKYRYRIVEWLRNGKLLIRLEPMTFTGRVGNDDNIEFLLLDLNEDNNSRLFIAETNTGLAAIDPNGEFIVTYNAPTPYYLGSSVKITDLKTGKNYYVKGFSKDMIVYWMDW